MRAQKDLSGGVELDGSSPTHDQAPQTRPILPNHDTTETNTMNDIDIPKIASDHAKWLVNTNEGKRADFTLSKALRGADLSGLDFRLADFSGADMAGANLSNTNLRFAKLYKADLHKSNMYKAYAHGAKFSHANLKGANLRQANLSACDLEGADFTEADLTMADLSHSMLGEAVLSDATMDGAYLVGSVLEGVQSMDGALLQGVYMSESNLRNVDMSRVHYGKSIVLDDALLQGTLFRVGHHPFTASGVGRDAETRLNESAAHAAVAFALKSDTEDSTVDVSVKVKDRNGVVTDFRIGPEHSRRLVVKGRESGTAPAPAPAPAPASADYSREDHVLPSRTPAPATATATGQEPKWDGANWVARTTKDSQDAEPRKVGPENHVLKCWPEYFEQVLDGSKTFDLRVDDRGFSVGDTLHLREFRARAGFKLDFGYSGRTVDVEVTSIHEVGLLFGNLGMVAPPCDVADAKLVIMSIKLVDDKDAPGNAHSQPQGDVL